MNKKITILAAVLLLTVFFTKAQKNELHKTNKFANNVLKETCNRIKKNSKPNVKKELNIFSEKKISLVDTVLIYDSLHTVIEKWICENNANGNIEIRYVFQLDTASNEWEPMSRVVYTYDDNKNIIIETAQINLFEWVDFLKVFYIYENNKILNTKVKVSSEDDWKIMSNIDYSYNNNGNLDTITYMENDDSTLVNSEMTVYTYNNNILSQITSSNWIDDSWMEYLKEEDIVFHQNQKILTKIEKIWNNGLWEKSAKIIYDYDNNGNTILSEIQIPTIDGNNWSNFRRETYTFNENGYSATGKGEKYIEDTWVISNNENLLFYYKAKELAYAEGFSFETIFKEETNINKISNTFNFEISPNPANDFVNINFENELNSKVEILDIKGVIKYQNNSNQEKSLNINISDFENGLYFVRIISNGINKTQKLIINK